MCVLLYECFLFSLSSIYYNIENNRKILFYFVRVRQFPKQFQDFLDLDSTIKFWDFPESLKLHSLDRYFMLKQNNKISAFL